ncbi:hypothetical protein [Oscillibacter sp.]|uniref:hypothetical protein n=1 Tax=Oscillibacter sp. TaxID=1945593 RepID=UPI0026282E7E|nr:hypothetical protein [Oscillibacter sp.]MDD3347884.1 hypothetical protein [Oscillibacter sp.]
MERKPVLLRRILQYGLSLLLINTAALGFLGGALLEPLMCVAAAIVLVPPVFGRFFAQDSWEESWWNVGLLALGCLMQLESLFGLAKTPESLQLITVSLTLGLITNRKYLKILWVLLAAVELVLAL